MLEKGSKVYFKDGRKNAATTHVWRALAFMNVVCTTRYAGRNLPIVCAIFMVCFDCFIPNVRECCDVVLARFDRICAQQCKTMTSYERLLPFLHKERATNEETKKRVSKSVCFRFRANAFKCRPKWTRPKRNIPHFLLHKKLAPVRMCE